MDDNLITH